MKISDGRRYDECKITCAYLNELILLNFTVKDGSVGKGCKKEVVELTNHVDFFKLQTISTMGKAILINFELTKNKYSVLISNIIIYLDGECED